MLDKVVGSILFVIGISVVLCFVYPDTARSVMGTVQELVQSFTPADHSDYLAAEVKKDMQKEIDKQWKRTVDTPIGALSTAFTALLVGEKSLPTKVISVKLMKLSGREYTGYAEFNSGMKVKIKVIYDGRQFMYETV
jgi:hypothetical protein